MRNDVIIMLSNRHVHMTREILDMLFGKGYELTFKQSLGVKEFAAEETISVEGPKGRIDHVRVLGPVRAYTQVELLRADCFTLGVKAPLRESGKTEHAASLKLIGPNASVEVAECGIIAWRHIHLGASVAQEYGLKEGQTVSVRIGGDRGLTFDNVIVRYGKSNTCKMHIDTEEGNAAGVANGTIGEIIVSCS